MATKEKKQLTHYIILLSKLFPVSAVKNKQKKNNLIYGSPALQAPSAILLYSSPNVVRWQVPKTVQQMNS